MTDFYLTKPITVKGKTTSVVQFRRPKAKDVWDIYKEENPFPIMLSRISNLTLEEVGELNLKDFAAISAIVTEMIQIG